MSSSVKDKSIGIGVIGTGFMGKAHSIAYSASASVFGTGLRPRLEIVCDLSPERASQRATDLGFRVTVITGVMLLKMIRCILYLYAHLMIRMRRSQSPRLLPASTSGAKSQCQQRLLIQPLWQTLPLVQLERPS